MAAYFSIYKGQEEGLAKLALTAHDAPCVQRAYEVLKTAWLDVRTRLTSLDASPASNQYHAYIFCSAFVRIFSLGVRVDAVVLFNSIER